jgi:hypothetical protein
MPKREDYEKNLQEKIKHRGFISDLGPIFPATVNYDIQEALEILKQEITPRI